MRGFVERRFPFLTGQPLLPLALLLVLNAVDEFDRGAFGTLAPEIRDAFHLDNTGFGVIVGFTTVLVLLGGLPVGFIGDRLPRTRLVVAAALLWGSMAVATGLAPVLWVLVLARFGSGIGRVANEAIHSSLLTDYYPQHLQGRVFGVHRAGNPIGLALGPLIAGTVASALGDWRPAFVAVAVPTFVMAAVALRLREPLRGQAEDTGLAQEAAGEPAIPLARAWRWLFSMPSLRRIYFSAFLGGGAVFALLPFLALFFEDVFGVGAFGRGLIGGANGLAQLTGIVVGGIATDRLRAASLGKIAFVAGVAVAGLGAGVLLVGIAPSLPLAVASGILAYLALGIWTSPNISVLAVLLPARIRSLGIGVAIMFFGLGGMVFTTIAGIIADGPGLRAAVVTLAPVLFLAAAIYISAARFVNADGRRALEALALEVELRHERLSAGSRALLVCRGLDVAYDGVQVLFGVDFEVREGEIVALLGTNGAGKSTLLRTIAGALHPAAGAVFFEGRNVTFHEPHETAAAGIAVVPGGRGVFPSLTVRENLELAAWLYRRDPGHVRRAVDEVVRVFPVLAERWELRAGDLSGGEQQMVTLSQAFIARPKLLLIDELSVGLAPILVAQLLDAVEAIRGRGTTIVLVEQSVNLALTVAGTAYFMEKGEIRFTGRAEELAGRTDLIRSVFLEGAGREGGTVAGAPPAPKTAARRGSLRGKLEAPGPSPSARPATEPVVVLEVKDLTKSYGGIRAVDEVSFALDEGRILGVVGQNGAGKTTVFDLISGFLAPDYGRVLLFGEDVTELSPETRALRGLGRSFQDARLFPSLTVAENVALALDRHLEVREPVAAALALPAVRRSEAAASARADELTERMGLGAYRDKFVGELSTGTRRVVDITCALAHVPKVLILDEPSSGIAQAETEALGPLLRRVRDELGCSLLVIEHDVPLVSALADELIALDLGRVIARGASSDVVRDPGVVAAYLGGSEEAFTRRPASAPPGGRSGSKSFRP